MGFKSATFLSKSLEKKDILEDIDAISSLTSEQRRALADFLGQGETLARKKESIAAKLQALLREHNISAETFDRSRKVLLFIGQCHDIGDAPEVVLDDLAAIAPLGTRKSDTEFSVYDFMEAMLPALHRQNRDGLCHRAVDRGMPALARVSYSCDVRMVVDHHFHPLRDRADTYEPKPFAWIPVAILNLTTDEQTEFYCQLDVRTLDKLFESLKVMRKDLVCAEKTLQDASLPARSLLEGTGDTEERQ
ncbi:MAG: hypothetical protein HQ581_20025 [Planctomycetes bacterium]|nr:hypothetical protein [Planctomycetota bacterium]